MHGGERVEKEEREGEERGGEKWMLHHLFLCPIKLEEKEGKTLLFDKKTKSKNLIIITNKSPSTNSL